MKTQLLAAAMLALSTSAFATDVGVSVTVGQPGFYGRIDLGNMAPPPVLYPQPVIIQRPARIVAEPMYLRVPPGHAKKWDKHCHKYKCLLAQRLFRARRVVHQRICAALPRRTPRRPPITTAAMTAAMTATDDRGHGKHKDKGHGNGHGHGKHKD